MGVAMTGVVIPSFVVAPLLVMIFAITLKWLPGGGWNGGALKFMILPMVALSLAYIASIARITRGSMIEVLHSNFIRTARAKGLPMRRIIFPPCVKTCAVACAVLYGTSICRHYYRFDGY
ncbi:oligopeptide transporter permease [Citrobacter braakii]|nr:oligopeptide transporter permease [Citrobacter braakii]